MSKPKSERNLKWREDGPIGPGWHYDFTMLIAGRKRRFRSFAGHSREAARNELLRIKLEALEERRGLRKLIETVSLKSFLGEFIAACEANGKRSVDRDRTLAAHLTSYFENKNLDEITALGVEGYKAKRKGDLVLPARKKKKSKQQEKPRFISPSTINRELSFLRSALYAAVEWGKLSAYPLPKRKLLIKEAQFKFRVLTRAEAKTLIAASAEHLKPIILTLLNTGMRKSEVLGLKWADVDLRRGLIRISGQDAKSGKARAVPMASTVFRTLSELHDCSTSEHVFVNQETGKPFGAIKRAFKTACRRAGIKCRVHDLRHTFASWAVESGCDLVTLKDLLGHSSLAMVLRYAHPGEQTQRLAVEKVGEFFDESRQKDDTVVIPKPVTLLNRAH